MTGCNENAALKISIKIKKERLLKESLLIYVYYCLKII